jgi:RNA polymerase sigma factor (sigma-70 family)
MRGGAPSGKLAVMTTVASASLAACSDQELVDLVRAGEHEALAEIAVRYRSMMLGVARPLLASTAYDAEDAVQDALLRTQQSLPLTVGPLVLGAWLTVVVRNRALDLRARRDAFNAELPQWAGGRGDVVEDVARRARMRETVRAVADLPERQRLALVGTVLEGRSHLEIARSLDTTVPAVKGLVKRARTGLAAAA